MQMEQAIPLAYFITFTCYGTWMHGDRDTSVDISNNIPGTNFLPRDFKRASCIKSNMREEAYILDFVRGKIVLDAIKNACIHKNWSLLAAHVRTNHIHVVVHSDIKPERVMNTLKAYSSRLLNETKLDITRIRRWTRHGSTRYLWTEEAVEATISYVVFEQGPPMAVFENKDREFLTCI